MKQSQQTYIRFKAIEYLAFWEGGVNASRLSRLFGIQGNVIGKALKQYRENHPHALTYDAKDPEKLYVITPEFTPSYIAPIWDEYINFIASYGDIHLQVLYGPNAMCGHITPLCNPSPFVTRHLLKAMRLSRPLSLVYKSRTNPKGRRRKILPHAIAHDGLRWHCRAYCYQRKRFADFNLGRMSELSVERKSAPLDIYDDAWHQMVTLHIDAHPKLDKDERILVLNDYGQSDTFKLTTRAAMVDYTLQFYRLGRKGKDSDHHIHPLIVSNIDEINPHLFSGKK